MNESEMHQELTELKHEVTSLKDKFGQFELEVTRQNAAMETDVRLTKHDVANLKGMFNGFGVRLDKMEATFSAELKSLQATLSSEIKTLAAGIAAVTVKTEKSASFVAGMVAVATVGVGVVGSLLMVLAKILFAGGL